MHFIPTNLTPDARSGQRTRGLELDVVLLKGRPRRRGTEGRKQTDFSAAGRPMKNKDWDRVFWNSDARVKIGFAHSIAVAIDTTKKCESYYK